MGPGLGGSDRIGALDASNDRRLEAPRQSPLFAARDQEVRREVAAMARQRDDELARPALHSARRKVLESLRQYWSGLTVFVDHPEVPMDNNTAGRVERGPVVGRKNYYGSGAVWAGQLAAVLFSVLETLKLWGLNAQQWLTSYLTACAANGGRAPADLRPWLPWRMTEAERAALKGEEVGARRTEDSS